MEVSGGDLKKYKTKYCFVQVGDQYGGEFLEVGVRVLPRPCGMLRHLDWNSVQQHFPHFSKVSLMTPVNRVWGYRILGTDCSYLFASTEPDIVGKTSLASCNQTNQIGEHPHGFFFVPI